MFLNIGKAKVSSNKCCWPNCNASHPANKLHRIPREIRYKVMKAIRFFIPKRSLACDLHCHYSIWPALAVPDKKFSFEADKIEEMVDLLCSEPLKDAVHVSNRKPKDVKMDTALTPDQFKDLFQRLPSLPHQFKYDRNGTTANDALYMYLMKIRTGRTNDDIGSIFNINRNTVTDRLNKVRIAMENDFVYENVNTVLNRSHLAQRSTIMSQVLFCNGDIDRPVLVLDGTYVYVQHSSNHEFQKLSYNGQKKRNFIRVMMCTTTDGRIVFCLGPYPASTNDAKVLKSIFENSNAFDSLDQGDVFLVDRGFRDCVGYLKGRGFTVHTPASIPQGKKQLSTIQANETRLVTANRYGVETRNGHFKTIFKIFQKEWNNKTLPHMMTDFRICAALINVYFKTIESNQGMAAGIATQMLNRLQTPNELSTIVFGCHFQKRLKEFTRFVNFKALPQLDSTDLIWISLGRYQIKQAPRYGQVHFKANNSEFVVFECPHAVMKKYLADFVSKNKNLKLLMARLKSRFRSKKTHDVFILIDLKGHKKDAVVGYCCECHNGLRTVGCCSHVMCVIWYALHIKIPGKMPQPASFLNNFFSDPFSSDSEEDE